jgi:hypothetical protein
MKKLFAFVFILSLFSCGNQRTEKDLTDSEEQNISPNQTITPEEQMKKDSTHGDIIGKDTTQAR